MSAVPKIARNAECPCGSKKKYKLCCMKKSPGAGGQTNTVVINALETDSTLLVKALRGCHDSYRKKPSHSLFKQIRLLESPRESIEFLYSLLSEWRQSPVLLNHLIVLLTELGRFTEANHFCHELLKIPTESNYNNWYFLLQIASYRSDLITLNAAMMEIIHSDAPTFMKVAGTLATRFCARRSDEVNEDIKLLLKETKLDQYCILLLAYCIEAINDHELAKNLKEKQGFSLYTSPESRLRKRIDAISTKEG